MALSCKNKQDLRKWARGKRLELDLELISHVLVKKLKQTKEYQQAKNVMIFYPLKDEVNLLSLTEDENKLFYLPKINGNDILCCKYDKDLPLCESCFHTKEPLTEPQNQSIIDLIIVPALAVDKNNYRLGYGKGFYDRFLKNSPAKTIVCISKQLLVETVFPEEHDIPVDLIITD